MVLGIERFKEWFQGYEDQYAIIGGTACDLLMAEEGLDFRGTKDIDLVLIVEAISPEFSRRFWEFVRSAAYLIPFKAKAWLDLTARKANGENVDSKNIRKHKNDVFRLSALLIPGTQIAVNQAVWDDLQNFLIAMQAEQLDPRQFGITRNKEAILADITKQYAVR